MVQIEIQSCLGTPSHSRSKLSLKPKQKQKLLVKGIWSNDASFEKEEVLLIETLYNNKALREASEHVSCNSSTKLQSKTNAYQQKQSSQVVSKNTETNVCCPNYISTYEFDENSVSSLGSYSGMSNKYQDKTWSIRFIVSGSWNADAVNLK